MILKEILLSVARIIYLMENPVKNVLLVLTEITVRKTALHSSMVDSAEKSVRVVHVIKSSDA